MNHCVTVEARATEITVTGTRSVSQRRPVVQRAGVPGVRVALLADVGHRGLLQLEVVRTVRRVTAQAVLAYGWVFPKERPALLGVTLVALVIHRCGGDHAVGLSAMRIVAVTAADLALEYRVP